MFEIKTLHDAAEVARLGPCHAGFAAAVAEARLATSEGRSAVRRVLDADAAVPALSLGGVGSLSASAKVLADAFNADAEAARKLAERVAQVRGGGRYSEEGARAIAAEVEGKSDAQRGPALARAAERAEELRASRAANVVAEIRGRVSEPDVGVCALEQAELQTVILAMRDPARLREHAAVLLERGHPLAPGLLALLDAVDTDAPMVEALVATCRAILRPRVEGALLADPDQLARAVELVLLDRGKTRLAMALHAARTGEAVLAHRILGQAREPVRGLHLGAGAPSGD